MFCRRKVVGLVYFSYMKPTKGVFNLKVERMILYLTFKYFWVCFTLTLLPVYKFYLFLSTYHLAIHYHIFCCKETDI